MRRQHGDGGVGVAPVDRLIQVALFRFCRHAGGRASALRIDHQQRQFRSHGQAERLGLQCDARPGTGGYAELAGIGGADGGTDSGDLVLRLKGGDTGFVEARQMMQERRGGGDGIGAEKHLDIRQFPGGDDAQRQRLRAGYGAVFDGLKRCFRDGMPRQDMRHLGGFAVGMASVERRQVGIAHGVVPRELPLNPTGRRIAGLVEHPQHQAQSPEVLAACRVLSAQAEGFDGFEIQPCDIDAADVERSPACRLPEDWIEAPRASGAVP